MRLHLIPLMSLVTLGAQVPDQAFFMGAPQTIAQTCADRAFARKPKSVQILVCLGQVQLALGDRKKAEEWFLRAERMKDDDAETYRYIAQAWIKAGIRDQVPGLAQKAKERAPRDASDMADFAVVLLDSGFPEEAQSLMDQAFRASPGRTGIQLDCGASLLRAGRPKEAATWFTRATATNPSELDTYREIALAYADHTRKADRLEVKTPMLAAAEVGFAGTGIKNDDLAAHARVYLAAGQRAEAEALFLRIMKSKGVHAEAFQLIGQAWLRAGFTAEAFRAYEVLPSARGEGGTIGFGGGTPGASPAQGWGPMVTINLAGISRKRALSDAAVDLANAGHFAKALPLMEEVFFADSEDQNDLAAFGRMALEAGHREAAARFFHKAIMADPKDWEVWCTTAQAHLALITRPSAAPAAAGPAPTPAAAP